MSTSLYTIITGIILAYVIMVLAVLIFAYASSNRLKRQKFISSYKAGKFFLIYPAVFFIYLIAGLYNNNSVIASIFDSFKGTVEILVLKYDYSLIENLADNNLFYKIVSLFVFILVFINAFVLAISLLAKKLFNRYLINRFSKNNVINIDGTTQLSNIRKSYCFIGFNEDVKTIISSIKEESDILLVVDKADKDLLEYAYINRLAIIDFNNNDSSLLSLFKKNNKENVESNISYVFNKVYKTLNNKCVNVIIDTKNDITNLLYLEQLKEIINKYDMNNYSFSVRKGIQVYVFGEPANSEKFISYVKETKGCVHYINKYKLTASDFIDKYPITEFMNDRHIDYDTGTIKDDVSVNMVIVGFGKTNQQIFLSSVANNQLIAKDGNSVKDFPINYWIYDKRDSQNDKNLNHNYYRFRNEIGEKEQYLELPNSPANEKFEILDINDTKFYDSIRCHVKGESNDNESKKESYNYIVIAFGSDLENLDLAEKLSSKSIEWGIDKNTKIFVRIRDGNFTRNVLANNKEKYNFIIFGNEDEVVYSIDKIIDEKMESMALNRHLLYQVICGKNENDALKKWYSDYHQTQRDSNVYAIVSLRLKLNLLGFDYKPINDSNQDAQQLFYEKYTKNDPILYNKEKIVRDKYDINYSINNFVHGTIRESMAMQEHQRWNAYMITSGFIPSTKEQIQEGNNRNFAIRTHGNITTFNGLVEFRKLQLKYELINNNKADEDSTDVIKYDYQILDDAAWILNIGGYKIVKR